MKPQIIASECGAGLFAKNTLAGFRQCLELDVDGIELDVHLSQDNHVVVQHDYLLNKHITRDATGAWLSTPGPGLGELTLSQIKKYDVGRYAPGARENQEYPYYTPIDGAQIPTLSEFIETYETDEAKGGANKSVRTEKPVLWVELKTDPFRRNQSADPEALLDAVLQNLSDANLLGSAVLLAFEWDLLLRAQQICPGIETDFLTINKAYLTHSYRGLDNVNPLALYGKSFTSYPDSSIPACIHRVGGSWWGPLDSDVSESDVADAQSLGLKVNLWGVPSTTKGMSAALAKKSDAITLSSPDKLMQLLKERGSDRSTNTQHN